MSEAQRRISVAVVGAAGRMGSEVCRAVEQAPDLELAGRYDVGDDLGVVGGADVAVDFTVPGATLGNVLQLVEAGVHVVVGHHRLDRRPAGPGAGGPDRPAARPAY